ncbi:MAG TPA: Nif3-like dinuclear metal center hexameric protein [Bacteroidales bacterium]|nr:Nif3-like dinuclear metal center hexameric protein [Bacteroidales bacterium]HRS19738.1 Nif3-like dinuclear metal center hexameric protein [Bacteroidales bacterium]
MKVADIINEIEHIAPLSLQESYDNSGLLIGNSSQNVDSALLTIDITEDVIDEAIALGTNLIISHHPLIFNGIKRINGNNYIERCIIKAIQHSIAIYCVHTNIDSVQNGVNKKICDIIGLQNTQILRKQTNSLSKIVTFVPNEDAEKVRLALCNAGAGTIGNYDNCSFNSQGKGTFRALDKAQPYIGTIGTIHTEPEIKIEVICHNYLIKHIIQALLSSHPYEEPAYDIIPLANENKEYGSGMIGTLENPVDCNTFLEYIKTKFSCKSIRYSKTKKQTISKVAVCGGSGSFLITDAIKQQADIFLTGDVKYHDFFLSENKIIIADVGHYESEQFTKEIFYEIINKKFPKFALQFSKVNTNPINYV